MSISRVVLGSLISVIVATTGCRVSVETKERWVEDNVRRDDTADWQGQKITIDLQGVSISVNGGVEVVADRNATKVAANARMLAMAFDKPDADQSIIEAKETFAITNTANEIKVYCGHGQTHGSSDAGNSGCEMVKVVVPPGTADRPLNIEVKGANGTMTLQFRDAVLTQLAAGNQGTISAEVPNSVGAVVTLVGQEGDDVAVTLPASWSADEVILAADADKITNPFADAKLGQGAGGRGTAGTGLSKLHVTSKEFAGSTGTITLR